MTAHATGLALYDRAARRGAAQVISHYSTSFGLASRLCSRAVRAARGRRLRARAHRRRDRRRPGRGGGARRRRTARELLDALEAETERAIARGYSSNLVVHAFAPHRAHDGIRRRAHAPVLRVDAARPRPGRLRRRRAPHVRLRLGRGRRADVPARLQRGAARRCRARRSAGSAAPALGAAFQKVNFLRDLADDYDTLGRRYFPGVDPARLERGRQGAAPRRHRRRPRDRRRRHPRAAERMPQGRRRRARPVRRALGAAAPHPGERAARRAGAACRPRASSCSSLAAPPATRRGPERRRA